jgi:hypothetical protein
MRNVTFASVLLLGSTLVAACNDSPTGADQPLLADNTEPSLGVSAGETFTAIGITNPSSRTLSLSLGDSKQMSAMLRYNRGGTLAASPYASWRSSDNCVATVTSRSPSWGLVKGVRSGTALIIAEAWGKADTVVVSVSGSKRPDDSCYEAEWKFDLRDVSFTGAPLTAAEYRREGPKAGERLTDLVLFAPKDPLKVGQSLVLSSELRYNRGGRLDGRKWVSFSVTDGAVARITRDGKVTAVGRGRTKVVARLGQYADTVPLYVR